LSGLATSYNNSQYNYVDGRPRFWDYYDESRFKRSSYDMSLSESVIRNCEDGVRTILYVRSNTAITRDWFFVSGYAAIKYNEWSLAIISEILKYRMLSVIYGKLPEMWIIE